MTWRPGGAIWTAAVHKGGAGLRSLPSELDWAGLLQCVRVCRLVSAGGNSLRGLHSWDGGVGPGVSGVGAGGVCGSLGGVGVLWGVGLPVAGVCGLPDVRGGEACSSGGSVGAVSRGPGPRALVGVCGPPGGELGGRGRGFLWGGLGLESRVLCRCMCPLAVARPCGHWFAGWF